MEGLQKGHLAYVFCSEFIQPSACPFYEASPPPLFKTVILNLFIYLFLLKLDLPYHISTMI